MALRTQMECLCSVAQAFRTHINKAHYRQQPMVFPWTSSARDKRASPHPHEGISPLASVNGYISLLKNVINSLSTGSINYSCGLYFYNTDAYSVENEDGCVHKCLSRGCHVSSANYENLVVIKLHCAWYYARCHIKPHSIGCDHTMCSLREGPTPPCGRGMSSVDCCSGSALSTTAGPYVRAQGTFSPCTIFASACKPVQVFPSKQKHNKPNHFKLTNSLSAPLSLCSSKVQTTKICWSGYKNLILNLWLNLMHDGLCLYWPTFSDLVNWLFNSWSDRPPSPLALHLRLWMYWSNKGSTS